MITVAAESRREMYDDRSGFPHLSPLIALSITRRGTTPRHMVSPDRRTPGKCCYQKQCNQNLVKLLYATPVYGKYMYQETGLKDTREMKQLSPRTGKL